MPLFINFVYVDVEEVYVKIRKNKTNIMIEDFEENKKDK